MNTPAALQFKFRTNHLNRALGILFYNLLHIQFSDASPFSDDFLHMATNAYHSTFECHVRIAHINSHVVRKRVKLKSASMV